MNMIVVGDHTPEPRGLSQQRKAELWTIRKLRPTAEEIRALADRYADAAQLLAISINNDDLAGVRSAYLTLDEVATQTDALATGIMHAIDACQRGEHQP